MKTLALLNKPGWGYHVTDELLNRSLASQEWSISDAGSYQLPPELKAQQESIIGRRIDAGQKLFNGPCISLFDELEGTDTVKVKSCTYYDFLVANDTFKAQNPDPERVQIPRLGEGFLTYTIGANTMAITDDGYAVFTMNAAGAAWGPGMLAPSAGGAAEPKDFEGGLLIEGVKRAMERELQEECSAPPEAASTTVLALVRPYKSGFKPNFFGITRLALEAKELRVGEEEGDYVDSLILHKLDKRREAESLYEFANSFELTEALRTSVEIACTALG